MKILGIFLLGLYSAGLPALFALFAYLLITQGASGWAYGWFILLTLLSLCTGARVKWDDDKKKEELP